MKINKKRVSEMYLGYLIGTCLFFLLFLIFEIKTMQMLTIWALSFGIYTYFVFLLIDYNKENK